eukprot:GHVR01076446.1.p1 GENE.GHVR01076446.1~~GHVR01076446.1.p1  ORF type:complete len:348 (-),score=30.78 GHVR01076446.1:300-1343(-)
MRFSSSSDTWWFTWSGGSHEWTCHGCVVFRCVGRRSVTQCVFFNQGSYALDVLHLRYGHATGLRLCDTLKEKGLALRTTLAACGSAATRCKACDLVNVRVRKIPAKADGAVEATEFNQVIYQDLIYLPARPPHGHSYASVIVDSATRFVSVLALKQKRQAIQHLISWVRRWESKFGLPKTVKTDNGTEFIGSEYTEFCVREGIAPLTGAPYTPQTQALVERTNQSLKRLLLKNLISLKLPQEMSAYLLSGVAHTFNELVHSSTHKSPYLLISLSPSLSSSVYGHSAELLPLAMGDVVTVSHSNKLEHQEVTTHGEEGLCFLHHKNITQHKFQILYVNIIFYLKYSEY